MQPGKNHATSSLPKPAFAKLPLLAWLAAISPAAFIALLHTRAQIDVDARRYREAKGLGDFLEVELVDVEDATQTMRGVGLEVGAVAVFSGLWRTLAGCKEGRAKSAKRAYAIQVVVLAN